MKERRAVSYVIFDMDGLLLDTESIYIAATNKIVSRYGKTFDWSVKAMMLGKLATDSAKILVTELGLPMTPEEYLKEKTAMHKIMMPHCTLLPGVKALVEHLHKHKVPMAVATSSAREAYEMKTQKHQELFSLFQTVVCGDDPELSRGKPAPDIFLLAASRLLGATSNREGRIDAQDVCSLSPSQFLVFEDSPAGVEAAVSANMPVVWIPDPNLPHDGTIAADEVLSSMAQFEPHNWGLPRYH